MAIAVASLEEYEKAVKKIFPRGAYWDGQLADPESDASLFAKAKALELCRFRRGMSGLHDESRIETASAALGEWERVLLGAENPATEEESRRAALLYQESGCLTADGIREIARRCGLEVGDARFPFRAAFFGFARFGADPACGPAAFSFMRLCVDVGEGTARELFREHGMRACFGFSRHGVDRIVRPDAPSALSLYAAMDGGGIFRPFEDQVKARLLAGINIHFVYGGTYGGDVP
jgi:hypothetical protein